MHNQNLDDTSPTPREERVATSPLDETQPTPVGGDTPLDDPTTGDEEKSPPSRARLIVRWVVAGVLVVIAIVGLGAFGGMQVGQAEHNQASTLLAAVDAATQYELAIKNLENGQCEFARQRFEFIINKLDPGYPGAAEGLSRSLLCIGLTVTPTVAATATVTPTPDVRSVEELFAAAQELKAAQDWDALLGVLDSLRQKDPAYKAVEVDGMYYIAYRNRGDQRILVEGNLEGGIFDLNRAEQFGPLDAEAANHRQWAILYVTGVSFWEVDWGQVVYYFSQLVPVAPNLWDGTMLATDRLATAQVGYAIDLINQANYLLGLKGWCDASALYEQAAQLGPLDPTVAPTATWAAEKCILNPNEQPRTPTPVP